jgi:phytol kinase
VHGVGPVRLGAYFYPPAVALTFAFAGDHPAAYVPALLALALGDAAAALVGQACGSLHYRVLGATRSVEGSLAMALVVFACVHAALVQLAAVDPLTAALWALHAAVLATLVEAVAPAGSDNLLIPVVTAGLLLDVGRRPPGPAALSLGLLTLGAALALAHTRHTREDRAGAPLPRQP